MIESYISIFLFVILTLIAILTLRMNHLFAVVMLSGAFSLVSALLFILFDAADVAFTEAAVGAGVSTVLMLSTMALTSRVQKKSNQKNYFPFLICIFSGILLIYGTFDMPNFGEQNSPSQLHLASQYISDTPKSIGIPNVVTAILASYRGFDTLGEVGVVFTAGVGVILLLNGLRKKRN